jgi:hypothetical protein
MFDGRRSFVKTGNTVARVLDGETVLVPIGGSVADLTSIFVMNEGAAHLWSLIDGRMDVDGFVDAQMNRYDVTTELAAADVQEFLGSLVDVGLVRAIPGGHDVDQELRGV